MSRIILDTGFFKAFSIPNDQFKSKAEVIYDLIFSGGQLDHELLLLWPIAYEVLNHKGTLYLNNRGNSVGKDFYFRLLDATILLDDSKYRHSAWLKIMTNNAFNELSLADHVLLEAANDQLLRVDQVVTFDTTLKYLLPPDLVLE